MGKLIIKDKFQCEIIVFLLISLLVLIDTWKFTHLYKMPAIEPIQATPGGPDTHDYPLQRGAAREAARPLFMMKKPNWEICLKSFRDVNPFG